MSNMQQVMSTFFDNTWTMIKTVNVPGFDVPLSRVIVGFLIIRVSIGFVHFVLGFRGTVGGAQENYRTAREKWDAYKSSKRTNM